MKASSNAFFRKFIDASLALSMTSGFMSTKLSFSANCKLVSFGAFTDGLKAVPFKARLDQSFAKH
jgi:hypothetical protein